MAYNRVNWQSGTKVSDGYVEIDGTQHTVTPAVYSGSTPINPTSLNIMDAGIKENSDMLNGDLPMRSISVSSIKSKNLFDKNNALKGYGLSSSTGDTYADENWYTSPYIQVYRNMKYYLTKGADGQSICFYTSSRVFVRSISVSSGIITVPDSTNISYMRFNGLLSDIDNVQLEKGEVATSLIQHQDFGFKSGKNTNGEWIKYDDGTMICTKRVTLSSVAFSSQVGYGFVAPNKALGSTPETFTEIFGVFASTSNASVFGVYNYTTNDFGKISLFYPTSTTLNSIYVSLLAIGRWK